jgi:SAM-dependent methyltransferase
MNKSVYYAGRGADFSTRYADVKGLEGFYQTRKLEVLANLLSSLVNGCEAALDIAFGDGTFLDILNGLNPQCSNLGIDLSLDNCQRVVSRFRISCADAERLPFKDHTFDLVLLFDIVEHVQDCSCMLREARRVLRPGRRLLLTTPNRWGMYEYKEWVLFGLPGYYRIKGAWLDLLSFRYLRYRPSHVWPYHLRLYSSREIAHLVTREGFSLQRSFSVNFCLPMWGVLDRLLRFSRWRVFKNVHESLEKNFGGINHLLIQEYTVCEH